jgi:hypothetical protein
MKFATAQPFADPEKAARKLIEIANSVEAVQDGRIYIELVNAPPLGTLRSESLLLQVQDMLPQQVQ